MSKLTISVRAKVISALATLAACSRGTAVTAPRPDAASGAPASVDLIAIVRAEDMRRADQLPAEAARSHAPSVRRRAARAFARILDSDEAPLVRALEDEDDETMAWGAYGLGESCRAHEESRVSALAARLASLEPTHAPSGRVDARTAIERALGRCGGDLAERTLRAWLERTSAAPQTSEAAAYALGEIAASRGALAMETQTALLDAAERTPAVTGALYPFGRGKNVVAGQLVARLLTVVRATLKRSAPERIFAVRALEEATDGTQAPLLASVLASDEYLPAERCEAARVLAHLGPAGQLSLADALATLAATASSRLAGDDLGVLLAAAQSVADDPPKSARVALESLARVQPPAGATASTARRTTALRCMAAAKLAGDPSDAMILVGCDVFDGEAGERARLSVLDRGLLTRDARTAWLELARHAGHVRVREMAIEAIARHPELNDAARAVLAEALSGGEGGVVAAAGQVIAAHPSRAFARGSVQGIDARIAAALRLAIAHPWPEDLVETRVALVEAGLAVGLAEARLAADAACHDANATVRARAAKALSVTGDKNASCPPPATPAGLAPEIGHILVHPVRISFDTDAGGLGVRLDPALAPIAVTRLVGLARSGFYTSVKIHRVVPGFVVQLGDPGGDGYGGAGSLLRCETSPVAFAAFDVGLALSGRDTGSSQIFVALARYPHLDGQYAWLGQAEGDWNAVVEGDLINAVHVED
ncbi:MAG: peptidylprolyl isomerase [Myxococcota bacterium]|nr:peptidylprolyl isomerase [Myxococcota bacterium]